MMKVKLVATCFLIGALLVPVFSYAEDSDVDRSHSKAYVKDSVITTKVKAKLAKEKIASLAHIKVDTDNSGVVWLSGTAKTQAEIDQAGSIASGTEGVASVKNDIKLDTDR
jgi:hyperosmotically inducible periplasmic protein